MCVCVTLMLGPGQSCREVQNYDFYVCVSMSVCVCVCVCVLGAVCVCVCVYTCVTVILCVCVLSFYSETITTYILKSLQVEFCVSLRLRQHLRMWGQTLLLETSASCSQS